MADIAVAMPFQIKECGYFGRGSEKPKFGSVEELLVDLIAWSEGKDLRATRLATRRIDGDGLPTYVADIQSDSHGTVLVLWNETPNLDGRVASIPGSCKVGSPEVVLNKIEADSVPGYPTYFYFLPEKSLVFGLRREQRVLGQAEMRNYLTAFLRQHGRHVVKSLHHETGEPVVQGYVAAPGDRPVRAFPRFWSELVRFSGERERMIDSAAQVTKIVRKSELDLTAPASRSLWQQVVQYLGISHPTLPSVSAKIEYTVDVDVSPEEVRAALDSWEQNPHSEWDDVGFVLRGESRHVYWASKSIPRCQMALDVEVGQAGLMNAVSLLREMSRHRVHLARLVG